jgi:hypothetical protein
MKLPMMSHEFSARLLVYPKVAILSLETQHLVNYEFIKYSNNQLIFSHQLPILPHYQEFSYSNSQSYLEQLDEIEKNLK